MRQSRPPAVRQPSSPVRHVPTRRQAAELEASFQGLGKRARNALSAYMGEVSAGSILNDVLLTDLDLGLLRNVGRRTFPEIDRWRRMLLRRNKSWKALLPMPPAPSPWPLAAVAYWLEQRPSLELFARIERLVWESTDRNGRMQVFRFLQHLPPLAAWDPNGTTVLIRYIMDVGDTPRKLPKAAATLGLDYDAMTIWAERWYRRFRSPLCFLRALPRARLAWEGHDPRVVATVVDTGTAQAINDSQGTAVGAFFVALVMEALLHATHAPVTTWMAARTQKRSAAHIRQGVWLVKKDLVPAVRPAIAALDQLMRTPRTAPEEVAGASLLPRCSPAIQRRALQVLARIVAQRYPTLKVRNGHFILPGSDPWIDRIQAVLERFGRPTHRDKVVAALHGRHPGEHLSINSVFRRVIAHPELFLRIGKQGLYGLRSWEGAQQGTDTRTIREIAVGYLQGRKRPVTMRELLAVVNEQYATSAASLRQNLKHDKQRRFEFPLRGHVRLRSPG